MTTSTSFCRAGRRAALLSLCATGMALWGCSGKVQGNPPGVIALALSNVAVTSITSTSAVVTWSTNLTSTSVVQYGLTTSYGNATPLYGLTLNHSVALSGLAAGTVYHYSVTSEDPSSSTTSSSPDATFTTLFPDGGIPASLIHWWKLDDGAGTTAADSAGSAPGALAGGAAWVSGADEAEAVSVGNTAHSGGGTVSFPATLPGVFTLSFWAKANAYGSTSDGTGAYNNALLGGETYLTNGFRSGFTPAGVFTFWTTQSGGTLTLTDATALPAATWAQFAITYSNGSATLYRDGAMVSTAAGTYVLGASSMGIDTGIGGVDTFWGSVDDVRLFDQVLPASEIANLYMPGTCTPLTACPAPDNCGSISNGCGGSVDCGTCSGAETCGGSGTANVCGSVTDAGINPNAFYVATSANQGNDSNAGTVSAPFATLTRCQSAMQASSTVKTCYIRGGAYAPALIASCDNGSGCVLELGSADDGETWSYYPPDGVDSADFTGGSTATGNGPWEMINVGNTNNVTINGLTLHNFQFGAFVSGGGTNNLLVENNVIFNGFYVVGSGPQNAAGFMCYGCANTTISHNVIHDIASFGISIGNVNGNISNLLITGNVLYNTCTGLADCGAIYVQDTTATATNIRETNNFVRDGNLFAGLGSGYGSALYADDCTSNLTASGNVITGRNGANTLMLHGGNNVAYTGNLIDLATYQQSSETFQTSGASGCSAGTMSGNTNEGNIVISGGGGGGYGRLSGSPLNAPTIQNNDYFNYAGNPISSSGAYSDAHPVSVDPQLSGWVYNIAAGSPVFNAPVQFPGLIGGWGPPGFQIPQTGTPPSSPH